VSLIERVYNYALDIVNENILACQKHKWACQRFLDDIDKIQNDDYPYYFDGDELYDFYDWAKMFKHVEGIIAGQPIELTDFQLFVVANIFCWKDKKSHTRKYKKAYIQIARKQGKSQLQAIIATYVGFLSEEKQQIYIAGVTKEQSKIVYNQILDQINFSDFLKGKYSTSYGMITHRKSGSIIQPLSKEARKTGDGKFPSLNIIDEYHAHSTSEVFDVLLSGMIGRKNALHVVITTAGLDLSAPCYKEYQYVSKILDPDSIVENEEYFVMIGELDKEDDIKDERNWIKANPIVCTYEEGIKDLRSRLKVALDQPEKMTEFMTKHMNVWVNKREGGYMDLSKWNENGVTDKRPMPNIKGKEVYIGIDLSSTIDLTSCSFSIPLDDGEYAVFSHSFIPSDRLEEKKKTDRVDYNLFVEQGWMTVTEGATVDYRYVTKYFEDLVKENEWIVKEIAYDPHQGHYYAQELTEKGYTMVEIKQTITHLSEPTKDFRKLVLQKKIYHDNNPVLNWALGNAIAVQNPNEDIRLDKSKSTERIDPIASLINAHCRSMYSNFNKEADLNKYITPESLDEWGW
jgi:phage terminase large subunit-like protein